MDVGAPLINSVPLDRPLAHFYRTTPSMRIAHVLLPDIDIDICIYVCIYMYISVIYIYIDIVYIYIFR